MLKRYFISNIIIILLLNLLVKPIWIFLIDRKVQLTVGHEEYGLYGALLSLSIIFNILLDLGITNYNNKQLASDKSFIERKLPNMLLAKLFLSIVYFLMILVMAFVLNYGERAIYLVLMMGVIQMLNSLLIFLRSNVSANHDFKTDSVLSILDKGLMILICGFLLYYPALDGFKLEWFIYIQIISYVISILIALWVITNRYSKIDLTHLSFNEVKGVVRKSIPYALLIFLMGIYMRSDSLLLERMEGAVQNSLYYEAYRVLDALNMIAFLFAGILLPMFSRMLAQKHGVESLVVTTSNIMLSASLALVAFSIHYAQEMMALLYPNDVGDDLIFIFRFVIASFPAFCVMYIYSTLLTANEDIYLLIKIALGGCVLSLGMNAVLISLFHARGAALTCFIVEWSVGILLIIWSIKRVQLAYNFVRIGKFLLLFVLVLIFNWVFKYFGWNLYLSIVGNIILFFILVYGIQIWDKKTLTNYIKYIKS